MLFKFADADAVIREHSRSCQIISCLTDTIIFIITI